jgi:hypothetical protein
MTTPTKLETARAADSKWALPYGPHTSLFNRAMMRRERAAKMDAELAKLTPANIAALEQVTGMLFECGYPAPSGVAA